MSLSDMFSKVLPGRSSLGLEITDTSVKIVELTEPGSERPVVRAAAIERLPAGVVEEGKIMKPTAVIEALQTLLRRAAIKTKRVHLIAPSQMLMVRFLQMPDLPQKELAKVIDFDVKNNLHLPFENPYYDFMKLNGTNEKGFKGTKAVLPKINANQQSVNEAAAASENGNNRYSKQGSSAFFEDFEQGATIEEESRFPQCDVMLVAAPKELIDDYRGAAEAAGLKPITMEFKALSLFRLIEREDPASRTQTLLILDINETASDISIFHEGQLKITRSVPVSFASGRELHPSVQVGRSVERFAEYDYRPAVDDIGSIAEELVHELERLMNFYRYTLNNRTQEFGSLFVSGDVEGLETICVLLAERFSQKVTPIVPSSLRLAHPQLQEPLLRCAVPLGLALRRGGT